MPSITPTDEAAGAALTPALADFWAMDEATRIHTLLERVKAAHAYHYERNTAYRSTVAARGIGPETRANEMPRLLRTTSLAFKSYIDVLGTPFPETRPAAFVDWLADQVSVDLRPSKQRFRDGYLSMEGLLRAVEREYSKLHLELLTSSGTSGRATIIPRDRRTEALTAESLRLCFERYLGVGADHTAIFMLPKRSRIAAARMAGSCVRGMGLQPKKTFFAVPIAAGPDQVRVRAGVTFRPGLRGALEKNVWHSVIASLHDRLIDARAVESAVTRLIPASAHEEKVLLFGTLDRLHAVATFLLDNGRTMSLAPGSVLVTAGGAGEAPAKPAAAMLDDLRRAFTLPSGEPAPIRDVYGMAEAGWAAMQCARGNYHLPPWVHAVTVDDQERFSQADRSTGLLAFFDPFGGGDLYPAFFRTSDRATLVRGTACACGEPGHYLEDASIRRIDLRGEAGCLGRV